MTFKTYEINVDLVHDTSTTYSNHFSQNDRNSAKLLVTITNKGAELDLSQAKSVRMSFRKPDGTRVFQNDCQPINAMKGKYQIVLKTQTLTSVGNVIAQIHIEEEDRILDTQKFFFVVNDSLASDEAVESTNEFTIIQKAIEAGEKLEGVDINGIIAAGELAKGALPKSGGTMTGNVDMDISVGSKSKGYRWRDATGALFGLESATDGALILYDYKNLARVWQYDPVAKRFTVLSDTNLLKTTGGTITGTTIFEAGDLRFKNAANDILFRNNTSGIFSFYDIAQNQVVWSYNPATKEFTVNSASNLLKKTGDTMTGTFVLSSANAEINFKDEKSEVAIQKTSAGNIAMWDRKNQKTVWLYVPESNEFRLQAAKTNIVTKDKDTRALITVTADAELTTSDGVIADRRGNTVTLRARVRRKNEQINTVFMMPEGMKPLLTVSHNIIANDGTVGALSIGTSGEVKIANVGNSLVNKDFNFTISYVVD
ncbi:BppU family phage baseplate upper protein [Bacillus pacificus]|uniref:BppU family phage baseplate upper protein n=1 Tax=Bacillus pacificus TaxID=2026187 RepID=UPI000936C505|nr:BppU family phage baseplate upper protein [Bacillus pacificus]MDK7542559.1 BppU family phage baseplate upper protein [Bacillus pacificus]MDK7564119.1 BppU family phage baseplate upper protein [Bacillus pacificus]